MSIVGVLLCSRAVAASCLWAQVDGTDIDVVLCAKSFDSAPETARVALSRQQLADLSRVSRDAGMEDPTPPRWLDLDPEIPARRSTPESVPPIWFALRGEARARARCYCAPRGPPRAIDVSLEVSAHDDSTYYAEVRGRRADYPQPWIHKLAPVVDDHIQFRIDESQAHTGIPYEIEVVLVDAHGNRSAPWHRRFITAGWPSDVPRSGGFPPPDPLPGPPPVKPPRPPSATLGAGVLGGSAVAIVGLVAVARRRM